MQLATRFVISNLLALAMTACLDTGPDTDPDTEPGTEPASDSIDDQALEGPRCLATQAGAYCGADAMSNADPGTLYRCPGRDLAPTSATACPMGCTVAPPGS